MPSRVHVKLARPEVTSEAELLRVTGPIYHPFMPATPLKVAAMLGSSVSTFAFSAPIVELSPNEESAQ